MIQDNRKTVKHSNFLISIKCYVWKGNGFTFRCRELKLWWAVIIQEIFSGYLKPAKCGNRLQQCDNPTHHSECWTVGTMKVFWEKASFSENKQILKIYRPVSTEKSILKKVCFPLRICSVNVTESTGGTWGVNLRASVFDNVIKLRIFLFVVKILSKSINVPLDFQAISTEMLRIHLHQNFWTLAFLRGHY